MATPRGGRTITTPVAIKVNKGAYGIVNLVNIPPIQPYLCLGNI